MSQGSPDRESFSTFTEFVIWQTGPKCISKKLAHEILSLEQQFSTNWLGRRVLRVASQRLNPDYFYKIEPMEIGEVDSIAKCAIEIRQDLIELGHQLGEVNSIAKWVKDTIHFFSNPRTTPPKHI